MHDAITARPRPARRIEAPRDLSYLLDADDYVAYWVYLCRDSAGLPERARNAMRDAVGVCWGLTWVACILLSGLLCAASPVVGLPCVVASTFGFGFAGAFVLSRIDRAPDTCFRGRLSKPYRRLCLRGLRRLARAEAREGTLDTESHFRFVADAEGFTLTTQPVVPGPDGGPSPRHEDRVPWAALRDVAFDEGHAFLLVRRGVGVILPRRCFADPADFDAFATLLLSYWAGVPADRASTAVFAPEDRLTRPARGTDA